MNERTLSGDRGNLVEMVGIMEQEGMFDPTPVLPPDGTVTMWRLSEAGHEFVRENNIDLDGLDDAQVLLKVGLVYTQAQLADARGRRDDLEAQAAVKRAQIRNLKRVARRG